MNRLALLITCLGLGAARYCMAGEPAMCKSMCASEQQTCRAHARLTPQGERTDNLRNESRNPFARTASGEVPSSATRALDAAGASTRQASGLGACDAAYQRCTRACATPEKVTDKAAAGRAG